MGRKSKYSKELKLSIVKRYLDGEGSTVSLAKEINATDGVVGNWVKQYKVSGENAFDTSSKNASYTKDFKEQVVLDYLNGGGSYNDPAIKYHISSSSPIKNG
ncbi:transposase [Thomasclavelia cocleata]|uniref:transposase n=1 Tax=Thomasclavelia cocleata TaxID=69824 RepID=UPI002494588C|nr:transposase [Thomasclavelia cocleata]